MNSTLEKSIIKISKKYNKNLYEIKIVIDEMLKDEIKKIEENELTNPIKILVDIISIQKNKEEKVNIWNDSIFKNISTLESNNVGNVGEILIQQICEYVNIDSNINGCKNKQIGGSKIGDGKIKNKTVEIKTARLGTSSTSFQHELGEYPWISNYMIFVDITPNDVYITIFKNFSEEQYKENGFKCNPFFPTKSVTQRKGIGNFKLDTTVKINTEGIKKGYSIIIKNDNINEICTFINKILI